MDLRQRLKIETKNLHDKIEQTCLLSKILSQKITPSDYQLLIQKFYGFIIPCEDLIDSLIYKSVIVNRKKKLWLEQDLQALKISHNDIIKIPKCIDLPVLSEYEDVLGYLYVVEGATLGGQVIIKVLNTQMQVTKNNGGRFFYGNGEQTKMIWNDFCSCLSNVNDTVKQNKVIHSASNTFELMHKWLEK